MAKFKMRIVDHVIEELREDNYPARSGESLIHEDAWKSKLRGKLRSKLDYSKLPEQAKARL